MKKYLVFLTAFLITIFISGVVVSSNAASGSKKLKLLVVSSYHREYRWSIGTNEGLMDGMIQYGFLDNKEQAEIFTKNDYVESSTVILKKFWMNTKRENSKNQIKNSSKRIVRQINKFKPDIIFLGDDNAANHIGNQFLDNDTPIVFWGVNNTPVKYGLVESAEKPGHNVTGVYQSGYYVDSINLLKKIVPSVETVAILADNSSSSRSHIKAIKKLAKQGKIPLKISETISTNDFDEWKENALRLQKNVDAFIIAQYSSIKNNNGTYVSKLDIARWYINNINIPEVANQKQFITEGMLCAADDSAFNHGHEAARIAYDILEKGANPATYPIETPKRGKLMVNAQRAKILSIDLTTEMGIEEYIEEALALK